MPLDFIVPPLDTRLRSSLTDKINGKTKPLGALGALEDLALRIGLIQQSLTPQLKLPTLMVFAGDHGIAAAGVSAYPQAVTAQMVANFLAGGAAINVFTRQHGLALQVVDAGVNAELAAHPQLIDAKIAYGTNNMLSEPAMTDAQCFKAIQTGAALVAKQFELGCNCMGFGEMGIGNTSSAALLMHSLTGLPLAQCVGRGTGLSDAQLAHKVAVLQQVVARHLLDSAHTDKPQHALHSLATIGGFEIAMMVGALLKAAECGMVLMIDGFIASSALLVASACCPAVLAYCIFSHVSNEQGHQALLNHFNATALLQLDLRLGEGSGVALAFPLLQSAVLFLHEMASFSEAGVDSK